MNECKWRESEADYGFCSHPDVLAQCSTTPVECLSNPKFCFYANREPEPRLENGNTLSQQVAQYGGY